MVRSLGKQCPGNVGHNASLKRLRNLQHPASGKQVLSTPWKFTKEDSLKAHCASIERDHQEAQGPQAAAPVNYLGDPDAEDDAWWDDDEYASANEFAG